MSTYYSLVCDNCKKQQPFTSQTMSGMSFMGGSVDEVPQFIAKHIACGSSLDNDNSIRVVSEHSHEYDEYEDEAYNDGCGEESYGISTRRSNG